MHPAVAHPAVVDRYFAAVNAEDWAAIPALFTADAEFRTLGTVSARGAGQVAEHLRTALGGLPGHHDEPVRVVWSGSLVVVDMRVLARAPDGRQVTFDAVDVIELSADATAIARLATWFDSAALHAAAAG